MIAVGKFITKDVLPKKDSEPKEPKFENGNFFYCDASAEKKLNSIRRNYNVSFWVLVLIVLFL